MKATYAFIGCDFQQNAGTSLSVGQSIVPILSSQCLTDKHMITQKKNEINLLT